MIQKNLSEIRDLLYPIFQQTNVLKAILFGSTAKGTKSKRSDIDLLILIESEKRFFDRYDDFNEIYDVLKGKAVDMLIYTPKELENISGRKFIRKILSEGQIIYEH
ncbi:MAG: nucleotidyltransferase domain-containing protein [Deltaproteobacteria bacterium]|nr:nucleotidyltransferase domain-containing protein [Deltaproteobacteria bacterium]